MHKMSIKTNRNGNQLEINPITEEAAELAIDLARKEYKEDGYKVVNNTSWEDLGHDYTAITYYNATNDTLASILIHEWEENTLKEKLDKVLAILDDEWADYEAELSENITNGVTYSNALAYATATVMYDEILAFLNNVLEDEKVHTVDVILNTKPDSFVQWMQDKLDNAGIDITSYYEIEDEVKRLMGNM